VVAGSFCQKALLVAPFAEVVSWKDMALHLHVLKLTLPMLSVFQVSHIVDYDGSKWLEGRLLLVADFLCS